MKTIQVLGFATLFALATVAIGQDVTAGPLQIEHPYALPTPPGATTGGAYLKDIFNRGAAADALIGASSPAAEHVELHSMQMDGNVMRMRAVPAIAIAPGAHVAMAPGNGYHLMMTGIKKRWAVGDQIPLTLQFQHAGRMDLMLLVQERADSSLEHRHEGSHR